MPFSKKLSSEITYDKDRSLTLVFHQRSAKVLLRQIRQLNFIGQFATEIVRVSGKENVTTKHYHALLL
uniref:Uncharacterized protein n=1 Tax=Vespula pensylvanica TaxID=30213 RepID=A0A834UCU6_VESPE|nr:hypothetical protein H0235_004387 [Vespula pensylvanica]